MDSREAVGSGDAATAATPLPPPAMAGQKRVKKREIPNSRRASSGSSPSRDTRNAVRACRPLDRATASGSTKCRANWPAAHHFRPASGTNDIRSQNTGRAPSKRTFQAEASFRSNPSATASFCRSSVSRAASNNCASHHSMGCDTNGSRSDSTRRSDTTSKGTRRPSPAQRRASEDARKCPSGSGCRR